MHAFATLDHYSGDIITRRTCWISLLYALESFHDDSVIEGEGPLMHINIISNCSTEHSKIFKELHLCKDPLSVTVVVHNIL